MSIRDWIPHTKTGIFLLTTVIQPADTKLS